MMTHWNCDKWTRYRIAPVTKFMEILLHKVDEWMIFISIQTLAWDNNYTDLSKKKLTMRPSNPTSEIWPSKYTMPCQWLDKKTVLLALQMLGIKIQEALHTHLFVTQIWSRCMNTIWNQPIIPDSRRKYEYFSSVLIIYWVWMPFLQRCSLSWFRQYFLWNANECVSTNSFKYTLKWIITI